MSAESSHDFIEVTREIIKLTRDRSVALRTQFSEDPASEICTKLANEIETTYAVNSTTINDPMAYPRAQIASIVARGLRSAAFGYRGYELSKDSIQQGYQTTKNWVQSSHQTLVDALPEPVKEASYSAASAIGQAVHALNLFRSDLSANIQLTEDQVRKIEEQFADAYAASLQRSSAVSSTSTGFSRPRLTQPGNNADGQKRRSYRGPRS